MNITDTLITMIMRCLFVKLYRRENYLSKIRGFYNDTGMIIMDFAESAESFHFQDQPGSDSGGERSEMPYLPI